MALLRLRPLLTEPKVSTPCSRLTSNRSITACTPGMVSAATRSALRSLSKFVVPERSMTPSWIVHSLNRYVPKLLAQMAEELFAYCSVR